MSSFRILYVDDEPDIREIGVMSLEFDAGFDVRSCGSGREALDILRAWSPDLILLDVVMDEMDGPATLLAIRGDPAGATVPVAFITARAQPQETERLMGLGAVGVIPKPFNPRTLADTVRAFLPAG